ncbi:hypothetical protein HBI65_162830 [Parastagonospora nodorum]|nr:hypothetical protein HBI72_156940 [Parastagonospora nodorum]KAH5536500.1 hypothetical protein HBI27_159680 [Parastagonospora nodorum]KAH5674184.1 hypothetical protein HBI21_140210 [Parastagonospora nodorum]KAH5990833.1 hypothetical protein HBI84_175810 [Parastagonospora nodorum]KAH6090937.1 hypothetical protein HBI65_162830 [Parastagonospora nodorum]
MWERSGNMGPAALEATILSELISKWDCIEGFSTVTLDTLKSSRRAAMFQKDEFAPENVVKPTREVTTATDAALLWSFRHYTIYVEGYLLQPDLNRALRPIVELDDS